MRTHTRGQAVVALCCALVLSTGCSRYPTATTGETVTLIAALRTACSSRNDDRLQRTAAAIETRRQQGELNDGEYAAFQSIVSMAREGRWQEAEQETYRFQEAQVR